jgi:hypothetical protein
MAPSTRPVHSAGERSGDGGVDQLALEVAVIRAAVGGLVQTDCDASGYHRGITRLEALGGIGPAAAEALPALGAALKDPDNTVRLLAARPVSVDRWATRGRSERGKATRIRLSATMPTGRLT